MRIAILDDYQAAALAMADWSVLPNSVTAVSFRDHVREEDPLAERLAEFDIVCRMRERTPFPRSLISRLPRLKLICATGARNPDIDLDAARDHGVTVCVTESFGRTTVEIAWWLLLSLFRRAVAEHRHVRAGGWQTQLGQAVVGKTLGIIGLGRLGSGVARVGKAFGMEILAWSPRLTAERAQAEGARAVPLDTLLECADAVSIHAPLTPSSRSLIGAGELARMKPGAFLVNTSRGPIVDEAAVIAALRSGQLGGLGVDVFDVEPLPLGHPLRHLPNVIATPHIGYVTEEAYRIYFRQTVENIAAFCAGRPIRTVTAIEAVPRSTVT
ncbi:MAG: D-2-hydroxyacid dehydrogenase family protein [Alphaproteobacteria bacterium]|nr:D-2-hydroxyacid dehydrogenase family protein [Alphaproteobacteria bacterium]